MGVRQNFKLEVKICLRNFLPEGKISAWWWSLSCELEVCWFLYDVAYSTQLFDPCRGLSSQNNLWIACWLSGFLAATYELLVAFSPFFMTFSPVYSVLLVPLLCHCLHQFWASFIILSFFGERFVIRKHRKINDNIEQRFGVIMTLY